MLNIMLFILQPVSQLSSPLISARGGGLISYSGDRYGEAEPNPRTTPTTRQRPKPRQDGPLRLDGLN